jgi:sugar phosphate isomerase/epimerase
MITRRHLLATSLSAAAAPFAIGQQLPKKSPHICAFTKHLQGLSFDQIADIAAQVGLNGIEAPIRPGGHVEPERIEDDLPKLVEALSKRKLDLTILTSGINEVSAEQRTEQVLRTAQKLGVKRFRMLYFKYDLKQPILPQVEEWRAKIKDLIALCDEIGIQPLLQNHSGKDYFGAPIWDAFSIMKDYKPTQFGFAIDSYHSTVEGGLSWPLDLALVASHIQALYLKDVQWIGPGAAEGVPLGTGLVSKKFASTVLSGSFSGPVSLHTEYMKGDVKDPAFVKASIEAYERDLKVVRDWVA